MDYEGSGRKSCSDHGRQQRNLEQPGTCFAAIKTAKELPGTKHDLLYQIFGIGTVSQQPLSQISSAVQVRSTSCSNRILSCGCSTSLMSSIFDDCMAGDH